MFPKKILPIINTFYLVIAALFLFDLLPSFDIKSQFLKTLCYVGSFICTPIVLLLNLLYFQRKSKRIFMVLAASGLLIVCASKGVMRLFFSTGAWRTQTILYEHGHLSFKAIEHQMQDVGALGYNQRNVEALYITPLFIIVGRNYTDDELEGLDKRVEWIKVDKDVNEMKLKY